MDDVQELVESGAPQSEVLEAAEDSSYFSRVENDDRYEVFRGRDYLLIGVPGVGVYTEDLKDQGFFGFVDPDRGNAARETTYSIRGDWTEVWEQVKEKYPRCEGPPPRSGWDEVERTLEEIDRNNYNPRGEVKPKHARIYMEYEEGETLIEFTEDLMRIHEKGMPPTPSLNNIEQIEINETAIGTVKKDTQPRKTL